MTKSARPSRETSKYLFNVLARNRSPLDPEQWRIMRELNNYMSSAFYLEINPLSELRRILPQYQWRFTEVRSTIALHEETQSVDFIWRTNWFSGTSYIKLVTASRRASTSARRLFFVDDDDIEDTPAMQINRIEFAQQLDCVPISRKLLRI